MKILFNIAHPAQVHLFKNLIWELEDHGHICYITNIDKDVCSQLLDDYGFNHVVIGKGRKRLSEKAIELLKIELKLYNIARSFDPDILIGGVANAYVAHVGKIIHKPSIVFDDTEDAKINHFIMDPFVSLICTPSCYHSDIGPKQIRYNGYHELAYLHPNYFTPNPAVLTEIGLTGNDPFIIVRFVSWEASHDVGQHGIRDKVRLVKDLEKYGRVLITSEGALPDELKDYQIHIHPERMHDALYYAALFIGESPTMTTESAILGTPAICVSSWACDCGNFNDLSSNYDLVYCYKDENKAIEKAFKILNSKSSKKEWKKKREKLLQEKIDVTAFMVDLIENFFQERQKS